MKRVLEEFRDFIERFYPSNPFAISFTISRVFVLLLTLSLIGCIIYLRSGNKNELELLRAEHKEIQMLIANYLEDMSQVNLNSARQNELKKIVEDYQKKLEMVDENIKRIKAVWFLE